MASNLILMVVLLLGERNYNNSPNTRRRPTVQSDKVNICVKYAENFSEIYNKLTSTIIVDNNLQN